MKTQPKDFLGTPIKRGERAIRAHSTGHFKEFKRVTVKEIKPTTETSAVFQSYKIGVITDGNDKIGWTFPERLIVESNFNPAIRAKL